MKEKLSAMMDDALEHGERERCVRRLEEDEELRAAWDVYHLIGDTLRGHTAPQIARTGPRAARRRTDGPGAAPP